MGVLEENSNSKKYIKDSMRDGIKRMAYLSHVATCVTLMPKPADFATQVIGEVNSMLVNIQSFSNRINTILETYSNFPSDYLTKTVNNVTDTLTSYANRATSAAQSDVDALTTAYESLESITGIDTSTGQSKLDSVTDLIGDAENLVSSTNENVQEKLKEITDKIKEKMEKVQETLNSSFSDYLTTTSQTLSSDANLYDTSTVGGDLSSTATATMSTIIKNFNIGKIATGFAGMAVSMGLVAAGLDELPTIDLDNVMAFGKSSLNKLKNSVQYELESYTESDTYKQLKEEAEQENSKKRNEIRKNRRKSAKEVRKKLSQEELKELHKNSKSLAKKIRQEKRKAKKAKMALKYKEMLGNDLHIFINEIKNTGTNIKDDWTDMMNQYKTAVQEVKTFFTGDPNEAPGAKYIDECCDKIEQDCISIKEGVKNLTTIITCVISKIAIPVSIGTSVDNPAYKTLDWFEGVKQILNEIRKIINYGVDIYKQIDKLVKIIITDIKNVATIKEELMKLLDIEWIFELIENIVTLFSSKCKEGKELLENTISPIFYKETDDYEAEMTSLENLENGGVGEDITINNWYSSKSLDVKDSDSVTVSVGSDGTLKQSKSNLENLEEAFDLLEDKGNNLIVAYKSPLLNDDGTDFIAWIYFRTNVDTLYGTQFKKKRARRLMKRASRTGMRKSGGKNLLINKNLKRTQLPLNVSGTRTYTPSAYDAFYWYTKWTNDPTDDGVDTSSTDDVVSPIMTTEYGTLVKLEDGRRVFVNDFGVKSGDYVLVEGKRYRVE